VAVQEVLGLPEPPHFLVPCYSATVDRYLNPQTQQLETVAEAMPTIWRYRALLDTVFDLEGIRWQGKPISIELCNPLALSAYREQFPELWENHDIVLRLDALDNLTASASDADMTGYVFRLFIRGDSSQTEETLRRLYETLDRALGHPYTLKVIDVLKHPGQVEADRVSATPTLIRIWPHPTRRIVGEIDDIERITGLLGY
jgi:circadian clock protein KaiB